MNEMDVVGDNEGGGDYVGRRFADLIKGSKIREEIRKGRDI